MKRKIISWILLMVMAVTLMPVTGAVAFATVPDSISGISIVCDGAVIELNASELPDSPQITDAIYTGIGKGGIQKVSTGVTGYTVESILEAAGISKSCVASIEFADDTGFSRSFSDLFISRVAYIDDETVEVPAIITIDSAQLIFGQTDMESQTANNWVKNVKTITVTTKNGFTQGDGSAENPYIIKKQAELEKINGSNCYKLENDIALTGEWEPVGTEEKSFEGVFDGNGRTISGLNINSDTGYAGLFGDVSGTVKNLTVKGSVITTAGEDYAAGIVAKLETGGSITGCVSEVTVNAENTYNVGGIVGFLGESDSQNSFSTTVSECINKGKVTGWQHVAGIAGYNNGIIEKSINMGEISSSCNIKKPGVGGIAGFNGNNNTAVSTGTINSCYNVGDIISKDGKWFGGIAGFVNEKSSVSNCYNVGRIINANDYTGAIVGKNESENITNCFSIKGTDCKNGYSGTELTSAQMRTLDFAASMGSTFRANTGVKNNGYPLLYFEEATAPESLSSGRVVLSSASYTYNGKIRTPKVTVKNLNGEILTAGSGFDYTVLLPAGRKNVGKYTVTVRGGRIFTGKVTKSFTINPKGTSIISLSRCNRGFKVKWYRQKSKMSNRRISGYQIRYSTNKNFNSYYKKTISGYISYYKRVYKLQKNRTYYVQVRTYMKTNSGIYHSKWSVAKAVKTK